MLCRTSGMLLSHHTFLFQLLLCNRKCRAVAWPRLTSAAPRLCSLPLGCSCTVGWHDWGSLLSSSWACANLERLRSLFTVLGQCWTNGGGEPVHKPLSRSHSMWLLSGFQWAWAPLAQSIYHLSNTLRIGFPSSEALHFCFQITFQNKLPSCKPLSQPLLLEGLQAKTNILSPSFTNILLTFRDNFTCHL